MTSFARSDAGAPHIIYYVSCPLTMYQFSKILGIKTCRKCMGNGVMIISFFLLGPNRLSLTRLQCGLHIFLPPSGVWVYYASHQPSPLIDVKFGKGTDYVFHNKDQFYLFIRLTGPRIFEKHDSSNNGSEAKNCIL